MIVPSQVTTRLRLPNDSIRIDAPIRDLNSLATLRDFLS